MADDYGRDNRHGDSVAKMLALLALALAAVALIWAMKADKKAQDAMEQATASSVIVPTDNTDTNDSTTDEAESNPTTNPTDNTGNDDAGGAGTGVNNNGAAQ